MTSIYALRWRQLTVDGVDSVVVCELCDVALSIYGHCRELDVGYICRFRLCLN
jgi:hypothetical protein